MAQPHNPAPWSRLSALLTIVLVIAGLYFAKEILIPLSLATLFAFLLTPAVKRLEIWKLPRIPAVLVVMIFSFSVVGGLGWIAANQLIDVLNQVAEYKTNIRKKFEAIRGPARGSLAKASESVKELSKELSRPANETDSSSATPQSNPPAAPPLTPGQRPVLVQVVEPPQTALQSFSGMLGPMLAPFSTAVIVLVFTGVILIKREDLRNRLLRLIGPTQLNLATEAFDDATRRVSRYLRLQFVVNVTFGALITAGLYFIGLPNALLWGVLAGVLRFIPYVGALVGGSLPVILALALFDDWLQPLLCLALVLIVEPTVAYVVEPALYGTHTGTSSLAILVSAAFWTALWGPTGLFLSTPLTVCLVVLGRHVPQLKFLQVLLGDEPVLTPAAQVYQRLLAMDQREARMVIETFLKEHPLLALYDGVLIPALSMAEEDRHKGALDETREEFVLQSLEEFIAELTDYGMTPESAGESDGLTDAPPLRQDIHAVCLPASDKADELTAMMLAQVLALAGHPTVSLPVLSTPAALLEALTKQPGDIVFISALPPFALMNARSLSKTLRSRFPELRIVLGLWNFSGGGAKAGERLGKAFTVEVVTTLAQALECLHPTDATLQVSTDALSAK